MRTTAEIEKDLDLLVEYIDYYVDQQYDYAAFRNRRSYGYMRVPSFTTNTFSYGYMRVPSFTTNTFSFENWKSSREFSEYMDSVDFSEKPIIIKPSELIQTLKDALKKVPKIGSDSVKIKWNEID